jgi:lysyl-tRNA synthetase class 1
MFWADKLVAQLDRQLPQIVNDSKTPSGRAHVGALRGVVIHDVIFRILQAQGFDVQYIFGVDDYDPLDELPYGQNEAFRPFLGRPLCEVPPPLDSTASDMAEHYIADFFSVFKELNIHPRIYRLRDVYRNGQFDQSIDAILSQAHIVRDIYKTVSGAIRPSNWLPLQMICEQCGRIGTTEAYAYENGQVTYRCRPDLVEWAQGCGYAGKNSPFGGRSKLPWKLEWVAKWATLGITVEGAGKDHNTKGGSRDVASACLSKLFNKPAPLNIPYEFFLVSGAKMSSSHGIGVAARDIADFLPPEVLRFLILRSQPNKQINFSPSEDAVTKLFNEFDRCRATASKAIHNQENLDTLGKDQYRIYQLSEVKTDVEYDIPNFQLIQALIQLPHLNVIEEIKKRSTKSLTAIDLEHLQQRIAAAKYWLQHYASSSERLELQLTLPPQVTELTAIQRQFLQRLAQVLENAQWEGNALQTLIFDVTKIIQIPQPEAFMAIYLSLFGKSQGPKAGPLFSYLDRNFIIQRLHLASND